MVCDDAHLRVIAIAFRGLDAADFVLASAYENRRNEIAKTATLRLKSQLPIRRNAGETHIEIAPEGREVAGESSTDSFHQGAQLRILL